jgi:hypothetical protein
MVSGLTPWDTPEQIAKTNTDITGAEIGFGSNTTYGEDSQVSLGMNDDLPDSMISLSEQALSSSVPPTTNVAGAEFESHSLI